MTAISRKAEWDDRGPYLHFYVSSPSKRARWVCFGFTLGRAPGSNGLGTKVHLWRMWGGEGGRDGFALRLFHSFRRPCFTALVHWRRR